MTHKEKLLGLQDIFVQSRILWDMTQKLRRDAGMYADDEAFDKTLNMYNAVFDVHRAIEDELLMFSLDVEVNK